MVLVHDGSGEIVARAERDDGEVDLLRVHPRPVNAVHNLVDAAVAAHHHQVAFPLLAEPFGRLPAPFSVVSDVQGVADIAFFQLFENILLDDDAVSVEQGGVGDDVPLVGSDLHFQFFFENKKERLYAAPFVYKIRD